MILWVRRVARLAAAVLAAVPAALAPLLVAPSLVAPLLIAPSLVAQPLVALAVVAAPPQAAAAAPAAPAGRSVAACTGVAVVVDFGPLGGGAQSGCATGDPSTGLAALRSAGFTPAFSLSGLVCQIDGKPAQCPRIPPTTAYWSYWHATAGGSWSYSNIGAGSYNPAPGTVEGWAFGPGSPPGIAPPPAVAPAPPPPPPQPTQPAPQPPTQPSAQPPARSTASAPAAGARPSTARPGAPAGPTSSAGQPPAAGTATSSTGAGGAVPASSPGGTSPVVSPAAGDTAAAPAENGGPWDVLGLVAGIVLVGGLAAVAQWTARRRARADPGAPDEPL